MRKGYRGIRIKEKEDDEEICKEIERDEKEREGWERKNEER